MTATPTLTPTPTLPDAALIDLNVANEAAAYARATYAWLHEVALCDLGHAIAAAPGWRPARADDTQVECIRLAALAAPYEAAFSAEDRERRRWRDAYEDAANEAFRRAYHLRGSEER